MAEAITKCGINAEYQMNFNCADLKKCGEISALLLGGEQEFYLNCGFCDFTYIQLNNFIQHILDDHSLELLENHSKQIKLEVPPCSQESLEQSGLENIAEVNVEENQQGFENYEESQVTDLLANDYENNLTSDAVIKAEFSQHPEGEENMAAVEENWEGSEIDEHKQTELHNDIATNNFDVEMMSELEDSTNKTEIKTRRKYTKKTKTSQIEDLEGTNEVLKATSSKKHTTKYEQNKKYIEKLKTTSQFEDYKRKKAAAMRRYRKKKKEADKKLPLEALNEKIKKNRKAICERVKKCRERKKTLS